MNRTLMSRVEFKIITLFPDLISHYLQDAMIAKAIGFHHDITA